MPLKLLEPGFASVSPFQFTWCTRGHSRHRELGVPGHAWLPPPHRLCPGKRNRLLQPSGVGQVAVPSH